MCDLFTVTELSWCQSLPLSHSNTQHLFNFHLIQHVCVGRKPTDVDPFPVSLPGHLKLSGSSVSPGSSHDDERLFPSAGQTDWQHCSITNILLMKSGFKTVNLSFKRTWTWPRPPAAPWCLPASWPLSFGLQLTSAVNLFL